MYDKMTVFYETNQRLNPEMLNKNPAEEKYSKLTGEELPNGFLNNLRIYQKVDGIYIDGSLAKFYNKNNLESLGRKETKNALEKLSDSIKVDIKKGRVYGLEIGFNIALKNPYSDYLEYFGDFQNNYLKKFTIRDTVYYSNKTKKIKIYNKLPEIRQSRQEISENLKCLNFDIMRIELSILKRLAKEFQMPVYAYSLYDESFYILAVNKLIDYYSKINKINKIIMNPEKYLTPKDYFDYLLIEVIQSKGLDSILNDIDQKRHRFNNSVQASNCKRMAKKLLERDLILQDKDLIKEIDSKVLKFKNYR